MAYPPVASFAVIVDANEMLVFVELSAPATTVPPDVVGVGDEGAVGAVKSTFNEAAEYALPGPAVAFVSLALFAARVGISVPVPQPLTVTVNTDAVPVLGETANAQPEAVPVFEKSLDVSVVASMV